MGFKPRGSKYYIFCVTWTYDPQPLAHALTALRYQLNKNGDDICRFHAMVDGPRRNQVFAVLQAHSGWNFNAIIVEKRKVNPSIYDPHVFYPKFASIPLKFVLGYRILPTTSSVMIYTDRLPIQNHKEAIKKTIKTSCRSVLGHAMPFHVFHHPGESNCWLQVADYCGWAITRKWERSDLGPVQMLQRFYSGDELDVMARGTTTYY
jgi:hypothetical protein